MQINAINTLNFESNKNKHVKKRTGYTPVNTNPHRPRRKPVNLDNQPYYRPLNLSNVDPQLRKYYNNDEGTFQIHPESRAKRGLRHAATAAMLTGALAGGGMAMQSCEPDTTIYEIPDLPPVIHNHFIKFYVVCPKPDTIVIRDTITNEIIDTVFVEKNDTVFLKQGLNPPVGDSIRNHLDSLGTDINGEGNVPLSIMMYDEYMQTAHKMLLDGDASTDEQIVMIDQRSDYSETDAENPDPEISYVRAKFSVAEGKGVYVQYEKLRPGVDPNKKHFEPADWVYSGEAVQTLHGNKVTIQMFDENGELKKAGEYLKGDKNSSIFYDMILGNTDPVQTVRRRYTQISSQWTTGDEYANRNNPVVEKPVEIEE